jgi:hypothetical protein
VLEASLAAGTMMEGLKMVARVGVLALKLASSLLARLLWQVEVLLDWVVGAAVAASPSRMPSMLVGAASGCCVCAASDGAAVSSVVAGVD